MDRAEIKVPTTGTSLSMLPDVSAALARLLPWQETCFDIERVGRQGSVVPRTGRVCWLKCQGL